MTSYRELQKTLKNLKANGVKVLVRLNAKYSALAKEMVRVKARLELGVAVVGSSAITRVRVEETSLWVQFQSGPKEYKYPGDYSIAIALLGSESVGKTFWALGLGKIKAE